MAGWRIKTDSEMTRKARYIKKKQQIRKERENLCKGICIGAHVYKLT